jgi:uncharacterized protein YcgI (DUF1989 family)
MGLTEVSAEEQYDVLKAKAEVYFARVGRIAATATPLQQAGEFELVREFETTPFEAVHFDVRKGQSFRFELLQGNQILDIMLLNRDDPISEYSSQFHTNSAQGPVPHEGYTFVSSPPYYRPMATIIADTVDYERLAAHTVPGAKHMFNVSNYRCSEGQVELATGVPNANSCNSNLVKSYLEIGGKELAMAQRHGEVFCIFQPTSWEVADGFPIMKFWESLGAFRPGDYIELIAQQDLTVVASSCPQGGQTNLSNMVENTCWPVAVKIYDTGIDLPDIEPLRSTPTFEFIEQGRPGMVESNRGVPGGPDSFEWESKKLNTAGE